VRGPVRCGPVTAPFPAATAGSGGWLRSQRLGGPAGGTIRLVAEDSTVLVGRLVRLRPPELTDVTAMLRAARPGGHVGSSSPQEVDELTRLVEHRPTLASDGFWRLVVDHRGSLVGDIQARATRNAFPRGVCEIGVTVFPEARGRGFGSAAVALLTARLHADGWPRVQASTAVSNHRMRRVLVGCGYLDEGVLRGYAPVGEVTREDYVMYASVADHQPA